ncbi:MAG: hypothetical protein EP332_09270 [Bacteroidetes bacterium]|nr:MAG: hypothetical protein EP332_09270 [Bacteroidota bacterium]
MKRFKHLLKTLPFQSIFLWLISALASYFLIAVLNISNEDLYNWELKRIFSEGGLFNQIAFLLMPVWLLVNLVMGLSYLLMIRRIWKQD